MLRRSCSTCSLVAWASSAVLSSSPKTRASRAVRLLKRLIALNNSPEGLMSYSEASSPSLSCRKRVVSSRSGSGESEPSDYRAELAISEHLVEVEVPGLGPLAIRYKA